MPGLAGAPDRDVTMEMGWRTAGGDCSAAQLSSLAATSGRGGQVWPAGTKVPGHLAAGLGPHVPPVAVTLVLLRLQPP